MKRRAEEINIVQRLKGGEGNNNTFKKKIIERMKILNILVTWSLDNSLRARSMRARGYGVTKDRPIILIINGQIRYIN